MNKSMNIIEVYYRRVLDVFVKEYSLQLQTAPKGHCMKVIGLPLAILEKLYDLLTPYKGELDIYILSETEEGSRYISATKLIELRNDLNRSILVLIPVNVSTAAEDSYGNTFQELSVSHLSDILLSDLLKEAAASSFADVILQIIAYACNNASNKQILDYLLFISESNYCEASIGEGLPYLGCMPDSDIHKDKNLVQRRMSINSECVEKMLDYSLPVNDRINNLPLLPNTMQKKIAEFLQSNRGVVSPSDLCFSIGVDFPAINFAQWNDCIKGVDVTNIGNLKITAVEISSKSFEDKDGDLCLKTQVNKAVKVKIRVYFSPKPAAFPDLKKIRIDLMNVDGMFCEQSKIKVAKVTSNSKDYRDITLSIKPEDYNQARYFFRVYAEDEHDSILNNHDGFTPEWANEKWEEEKDNLSLADFQQKYKAFLLSDSESFFLEINEEEETIEGEDSRREKISNVLQAYFHYRIEQVRKKDVVELTLPERQKVVDKGDKSKLDDIPWKENAYSDIFRLKYSKSHNYQIILSKKLLEIERCLLKYKNAFGTVRVKLASNPAEGIKSMEFTEQKNIDIPQSLLDKRAELFQLIQDSADSGSGVLETFDVFNYATLMKDYISEYQSWLKVVMDQTNDLEVFEILQNLDLVTISVPLPNNKRELVKVISPLHPLRLAWMVNMFEQYDEWETRTFNDRTYCSAWYKKLDKLFYGELVPNVAPLILRGKDDNSYMQYVGELMYGWGFYADTEMNGTSSLASGFRQLKSYLAQLLNIPVQYRVDTDVNAKMVYRYIQSYITQHPYTNKLVINLFNAGDAGVFANNLVELERFCKPFDIHYEIRLFGADEKFSQGEALKDLINPDSQISEDAEMFSQATSNRLFPKLRFSINSVEDFVENASNYPAHMSFLINPFPASIKLHKPSNREQSFFLNGVVTRPVVQVAITEKGCRWQRFFSELRISDPASEFANETIGLFSVYQSLVAMGISNDRDISVPALSLNIEDTNSVMLSRIHDVSDWVVTFDKNMGAEFYDIPCGDDEVPYLLDYIPSTELTGVSSFLTCRPTSEIESILAPHFMEFGIDISDKRRFYGFLQDIRSVSSSMIMQLNSSKNKAFEVLGTTLMKRLLKGKDLLQDSFIIPVDLHKELFNAELETKNRADDLLVDIHPKSSEIVFTVIEIKCRQSLSDDQRADLQSQMMLQINNTVEALRLQFEPDNEHLRLDQELKVIELQSLLMFYLKRAHRYGYLCEDAARENEAFVQQLRKDNYSIRFKKLGLIFEFKGDHLQKKEIMYSGDEETVFYTMGKPMIDRILDEGASLMTVDLNSAPDVELRSFFEVSERALYRSNIEPIIVEDDILDADETEDKSTYPLSAEVVSPVLTDVRVSYGPTDEGNALDVSLVHNEALSDDEAVAEVVKDAPIDDVPVVKVVKPVVEVPVLSEAKDVHVAGYIQPKFDIMIGKSSPISAQYGIIGKAFNGDRTIAIDLSETNTISLFGVQGGGKSYTIGTISEMTLKEVSNINLLPAPMASVIFHYSESMDYAPEFTSMIYPNDDAGQLRKLKDVYGAEPTSIEDVIILAPRDMVEQRQEEYPSIQVLPIEFSSKELNVQDWRFLLKAVKNDSTYIAQLSSIMRANRKDLNLRDLTESVENSSTMSTSQKNLAMQRLDFAREYINDEQKLSSLLKPGRLIVVDLRDEWIEKDDALGLFVIMLNIFSGVKEHNGVSFNKFIVFDEAHKYMGNKDLTQTIVTAIREMRHKGVSMMIASQDPMSLPIEIIELSSVVLMHKFNSPSWVKHVQKSITQLQSLTASDMANLVPGEAYLWATKATDKGVTNRPMKISTRPRVTKHGGDTIKAV